MQYLSLGQSDIEVSRVCLGTMTWGIQNSQKDADEQMAIALEHGINFIDTAEMYPVPPNQETYGDTERIIGDWLSRHPQKRDELVLASKIAGAGLRYIREGSPISKHSIMPALDESLSRLQSDYIDLYQLHWPTRKTAHFGTHWPNQVKPTRTNITAERDAMAGVVASIGEALACGKIRHWGLSDDTPWGIHTYLQLCDELNVARPVSIQNEFSLLHLKDWPYLIETCVFENIAYLPWSPLATGLLSGKYSNGARPTGSRWSITQRNGLFRDTELAHQAVDKYCALAHKYELTPSQLALAWCNQVDGVTAIIIGATSVSQLEEDLSAFELSLSPTCIREINEITKEYPVVF